MTKRATRGGLRRARGRARAPRGGLRWRATTRPAPRRRDVHDRHDGGEGRQGGADHRPRPAQRQRLQRARLQRAQAGRARARDQGACRRVEVGRRLRPEHDDARAAGLRPHHRRRVRAGRRDRDGGEEVPEHELRDRRRRPELRSRASRRTSAGLLFKEQEVGYLVGYLAALEAKSAGGKRISAVGGFKEPPVDRYIAGYKAGPRRPCPARSSSGGTRRTGTIRRSARSSR